MNETNKQLVRNWQVTLITLAFVFSLVLAATTYRYGVLHSNDVAVPSLTVDGKGEATALPDIATITFSITEVSPNVKDAQKKVEDTMKKVNDGLKALDIASKDIKTESYTVSPKYSYPQPVCTVLGCPSALPKLEGYEVSEYVLVKVRKIDTAGDVLALLGNNEVKNISGPNFGIENSDKLVALARAEAIDKAKEKAKETAKSLGKSLGEIKVYTENNGNTYPMMYAKDAMASSAGTLERVTLAQGETKVTVNVSLTYSLK
jgi:uncharacterized protein YggE